MMPNSSYPQRKVVQVLSRHAGSTLVELECAHRARYLGDVFVNAIVDCDFCRVGAMPAGNRTHSLEDDDGA